MSRNNDRARCRSTETALGEVLSPSTNRNTRGAAALARLFGEDSATSPGQGGVPDQLQPRRALLHAEPHPRGRRHGLVVPGRCLFLETPHAPSDRGGLEI